METIIRPETHNRLDIGIDLITHHVGEVSAGKSYLLSGDRGAGKTTFLLQFIYQGLKERKPCVLISPEPPERLTAYAQSMRMDLSPFFRDETLLMYEIARKGPYPAAELLRELEAVITQYPASRFALDGLTQFEGISALLDKLERGRTTTFITAELPDAQVENACTGSFLMKGTPEQGAQSLLVRKLAGSRADGSEFQFKVEPGRGIVESVKTRGIRFPRPDEH